MSHIEKSQNLLQITQTALEYARQSEWEKAQELEEKRQQIARELFATSVPESEITEVRACVDKVFELNSELIQLGRAEKQAVVSAMQKIRKGSAAQQAYKNY